MMMLTKCRRSRSTDGCTSSSGPADDDRLMTLRTTPIGMSGGASDSLPPAVKMRSPSTMRPNIGVSSSRSTWGNESAPWPLNLPVSRGRSSGTDVVVGGVAVVVVSPGTVPDTTVLSGAGALDGGTDSAGAVLGTLAGSDTPAPVDGGTVVVVVVVVLVVVVVSGGAPGTTFTGTT